MVQNPPEGNQRIIPYLYYADGAAAVDFLTRTFGFEERMRMHAPDGSITHAEVGLDDNVVMLGAPEHMKDAPFPQRHGGVMCYVDDVDAHYAHAKAEGATITTELHDAPYGDRTYTAEDPEGHTWFFSTHVRDVSLAELEGQAE